MFCTHNVFKFYFLFFYRSWVFFALHFQDLLRLISIFKMSESIIYHRRRPKMNILFIIIVFVVTIHILAHYTLLKCIIMLRVNYTLYFCSCKRSFRFFLFVPMRRVIYTIQHVFTKINFIHNVVLCYTLQINRFAVVGAIFARTIGAGFELPSRSRYGDYKDRRAKKKTSYFAAAKGQYGFPSLVPKQKH